MPMEKRKNRRGRDEYYVSGRHLNLNQLKTDAQGLRNVYLYKENIPTSPKPEFHVAHLKHDTGLEELKGIRTDEGFKNPYDGLVDPHGGVLLWWSLAVGPEEVKSAETRLLQQNFSDLTEDQAAMHPSFLYKFTTSPAFSETSRLGSYRFTFPLEEVLEAYRKQFCKENQPVMRVYETVLHKQEVQHVVLVHSPANDDRFSKYPLLTDDPNAICVYKDGRFIWRPYAMSETHSAKLICRPEMNQMDVQTLYGRDRVFYIWDNVAIALHVDQEVLKFDADRLKKNLTFCDEGQPKIGTGFVSYERAKDEVKDLWSDCDSPLEKERSLEQHFRVRDLRLVLVGRAGSGKSSSGNIILGRDAFRVGGAAASTSSGNAQCCLQMGKVSKWDVKIVDTPGLSETPEVKTEIKRCLNMLTPGPHAFLLVIRVGIPIDGEVLRQMEEIFGENVWRHTLVVLTYDDQLNTDLTKSEVRQILPQIVGDRYYDVCINPESSGILRASLLNAVEKMVVENGEEFYSVQDRA